MWVRRAKKGIAVGRFLTEENVEWCKSDKNESINKQATPNEVHTQHDIPTQ